MFSNFNFFWFLQNLNLDGKDILENNIFWYASYSKFATLTDCEKNQVFVEKNPFFSKNPNFILFEKPYYFIRILRRICHKLMIENFHGQKRRTSDTFTSDVINWQISVKNVGVEIGWFSSYIINMAENYKRRRSTAIFCDKQSTETWNILTK